jgi:hypothetical protein
VGSSIAWQRLGQFITCSITSPSFVFIISLYKFLFRTRRTSSWKIEIRSAGEPTAQSGRSKPQCASGSVTQHGRLPLPPLQFDARGCESWWLDHQRPIQSTSTIDLDLAFISHPVPCLPTRFLPRPSQLEPRTNPENRRTF